MTSEGMPATACRRSGLGVSNDGRRSAAAGDAASSLIPRRANELDRQLELFLGDLAEPGAGPSRCWSGSGSRVTSKACSEAQELSPR